MTLPTRKFEIFDEVKIHNVRLKSKADGGFERTTATGEAGQIIGYAITDDGWEYFVKVTGLHRNGTAETSFCYHKWTRTEALEKIDKKRQAK